MMQKQLDVGRVLDAEWNGADRSGAGKSPGFQSLSSDGREGHASDKRTIRGMNGGKMRSAPGKKRNVLRSGKARAILLLILIQLGFWGCSPSSDPVEIVEVAISDEVAEQRNRELLDELSFTLADGLTAHLWASEELLSDPVALHMDDYGRAWVSSTERRRAVDLDIRRHRDWMVESITFETLEDRRNFIHQELASERSDLNREWLEDFNEDGVHDWRDLMVHKESVFMLEDPSDSGHATRSQLFVRDFHEEVTDVANGVLYHEGDVYLGISPDLMRLRDTDGDGVADEMESIAHGFGVQFIFAGHGVSGLKIGPDGRLYWSVGDMGLSVTDQGGKVWHNPRNGAIVRSDLDGSNFEIFAYGFRNVHEFSFDQYGNLITVDNDGDHAGESEGLIYVINGADSGWRTNWQYGKFQDPKNNNYNVLMAEQYYQPRFEGQAAHILPPISLYHNGPAGMAYNPGTALGEEWKDHFFVVEFTGTPLRSGIHAFTLTPEGASFKIEKDFSVMRGILATGLSFGPDGALYFADWIDSWALKDAGRIWKLDTPEEEHSPIRAETRALLEEDFSGSDSARLMELMAHEDMRIRKKSQFELVGRDEASSLEKVAASSSNQLARIHGIWGLAQLGRKDPEAVTPLIGYLNDPDPEIRAQAARMLGDVKSKTGGDSLIPLLEDEEPRVRFFAAEALGRMGLREAVEPIVKMLEANDEEDHYLRLAGAIALERIGDEQAIASLASHPSRAVRIAAVVALRRLESAGVVRFLQDDDEEVVTNAARAINDDRLIEEGVADLAAMLSQNRFTNEPLLRRAINANLLDGSAASAERLAAFALQQELPEALRIEALHALSVWPEPSVLDRVTGDPRGAISNNPEFARSSLRNVLPELFGDSRPEVKIAGIEAASTLHIEDSIPGIQRLIREDSSPDVQIAALGALVRMEIEGIEEMIFAALESDNATVRMVAMSEIPVLDLPAESVAGMMALVLETGTLAEQQTAFNVLAERDHSSVHALLEEQFDRLIRGELNEGVELELVLAAEQAIERAEETSAERLRGQYQQWEDQKRGGDRVRQYRESLYGGTVETGRVLFHQNEAAQCIRCHIVNGEGSEVGPDLTRIATTLTRRQLLESMVDPNARIAPGYGSVRLTLQNGESVSGLLKGETEESVIVAGAEEERVIPRSEIADEAYSPSGMFDMSELLTRKELRDLVAYLMSLDGSGGT